MLKLNGVEANNVRFCVHEYNICLVSDRWKDFGQIIDASQPQVYERGMLKSVFVSIELTNNNRNQIHLLKRLTGTDEKYDELVQQRALL